MTDIDWDEALSLLELEQIVKAAYFRHDTARLLQCPPSITNRCWDELADKKWNEHAASILFNRARGMQESNELAGALELKRLYERVYCQSGDFADTVVHALTRKALSDFRRKAATLGLSEDEIAANQMAAVEQCYFGPERDVDSHFVGGCVLLAYRSAAREVEPTGFLAAIYAAREAYAFFVAAQAEAARDSLAFAVPIFERLAGRIDREQTAAAGLILHYTGVAAKSAGDLETHVEAMRLALHLLPPSGDERAATLFYLAEDAERSGKPAEQLRLLKAAAETPDVEDRELLQMVRGLVSMLRVELEGNVDKMDVPDGALLGIPRGLALMSKELAAKAAAGVSPLPDDEYRYALALIEWIEYCEGVGNSAGAFWACVMLLKVRLSVHSGMDFPLSVMNILARAERHNAFARPEDVIEFQLTKKVAEALARESQ